MLQKYDRGASKHVYDIVTGNESWICAYEPKSKYPTKVARARSISKQMIACFFGRTGHVAIVRLEQHKTVNSDWYTTIPLPVVFHEIRKSSRRRRITLHHDIVSSHTTAQTTSFLSTQNIDLMSHAADSPDLAPNDFFLFPYVKNKMRDERFSTPEETVDAFRMLVLEIPQSEWQKHFHNLYKRMLKCIDLNGEYFEKQ